MLHSRYGLDVSKVSCSCPCLTINTPCKSDHVVLRQVRLSVSGIALCRQSYVQPAMNSLLEPCIGSIRHGRTTRTNFGATGGAVLQKGSHRTGSYGTCYGTSPACRGFAATRSTTAAAISGVLRGWYPSPNAASLILVTCRQPDISG